MAFPTYPPEHDGATMEASKHSTIVDQNAFHNIKYPGDDGDGSTNASATLEKRWKLAWLRHGLVLGLLGMLVAIGCILASLAVLLASDGAPVEGWNIQPSAFLATFTAVANQSLRFACLQSVVVAWWCRAPKGTSLKQMHQDWHMRTSFCSALCVGRRLTLLGLACITSTLVVVEGSLLQKASTVVSAPITDKVISLNVSIAPQIPRGFGGGCR